MQLALTENNFHEMETLTTLMFPLAMKTVIYKIRHATRLFMRTKSRFPEHDVTIT
jgi:hypothetical protein